MRLIRLLNRHPTNDLSAFIDGVLPEGRHASVARHVTSCDRCSFEIDSLRTVSETLHDLPQAAVPRSFVLTPESANQPQPPEPSRPPRAGLLNALRVSGAAVAVALAVVLVIDFGGGENSTTDDSIRIAESAVTDSDNSFSDGARDAHGPASADGGAAQEEGAAAPQATGTPPSLDEGYQAEVPTPAPGVAGETANIDASPKSGDLAGGSTLRTLEAMLAALLLLIVVTALVVSRSRPRRADS